MQIISAEEAIEQFDNLQCTTSGTGEHRYWTIDTRRKDGSSRTAVGLRREILRLARGMNRAVTVATDEPRDKQRCVPALGVYRYDRPDGTSFLA